MPDEYRRLVQKGYQVREAYRACRALEQQIETAAETGWRLQQLQARIKSLQEQVNEPPTPGHDCCPPRAGELYGQIDTIDRQVNQAKQLLHMRKSLALVTDDYMPAADLESVVSDGTKRTQALEREIRGVLEGACRQCGSNETCPASMTHPSYAARQMG